MKEGEDPVPHRDTQGQAKERRDMSAKGRTGKSRGGPGTGLCWRCLGGWGNSSEEGKERIRGRAGKLSPQIRSSVSPL